jgi:phosphohistidine phosphatase
MDLILWRHAEAEDGADDLQRALTARGRRQASRMAEWLRRNVPAPWTVYASPARRTQETVAALHVPFLIVESCRPGAAAEDVLQAVGWPDHAGSVILVGHQPTLGMATALAMTGTAAPWSVRKGAIMWLGARSREDGWPVQLRASLTPELI